MNTTVVQVQCSVPVSTVLLYTEQWHVFASTSTDLRKQTLKDWFSNFVTEDMPLIY